MNKQNYENAQKTNKMWEQICRQVLNLWKIVRLFFVKVFWTGDAIYIREQYDKMSFSDDNKWTPEITEIRSNKLKHCVHAV